MDGFLIIDKPAGPTSHNIVQEVKRLLKAKKVGHLGTLDPEATGVLPLVVNKATKLAAKFANCQKVYEFDLVLGRATDTDDDTGRIIKEGKVPRQANKLIKDILPAFTGEIIQKTPTYSALKIKGARSYLRARMGESVKPRSRLVTINKLEVLEDPWSKSPHSPENGNPRFRLRLTCSSGTYVRALCRDIGEKIGCFGHAAAIRRLVSGPFKLEGAIIFGKFRLLNPEQRSSLILKDISFYPEPGRGVDKINN